MKRKTLITIMAITLLISAAGCGDTDAASDKTLGNIVMRGDTASNIDKSDVGEPVATQIPEIAEVEVEETGQADNVNEELSEEASSVSVPIEIIEVEDASDTSDNENMADETDVADYDPASDAGYYVEEVPVNEPKEIAPGENISLDNISFKMNVLYEESLQKNILRDDADLRNFILKYADGLPESFVNDTMFDEVFDHSILLCTVISSGYSTARYESTSAVYDEAGNLNVTINQDIVQTLTEEQEGSTLVITQISKDDINDDMTDYNINLVGME